MNPEWYNPIPEAMKPEWYAPPVIPKAVKRVFNEPDQYKVLCDFCRCMQNLVVKNHVIVEAFCRSCRAKLSHCESNLCRTGTPDCESARFVDAVGAVAPNCRGCHEHNRKFAKARKTGGLHGKARGDKSREGRKVASK